MFKPLLMISALMAIGLLSGCGEHTHDWGETTYTWSSDNSTCTAETICKGDNKHKESETISTTFQVITAATCEKDGKGRYSADFSSEGFVDQTKDVVLNPIGHNFGAPTYTWSDDNKTCTAKRVCSRDANHIEEETVNSTYQVVTPATVEADGSATYTATFSNSAFVLQTKNITLPKDVYAKKPHLSADGKIVQYGLYPQKNVNDSSLVSELDKLTDPESNGWYLYNDEYYAKTVAKPNKDSYKFDDGTSIEKDETYWFKCEPIVWNVLSNSEGQYYILSSTLLDVHKYDDDKNLYDESSIRSWLNDDFLNTAFALGNDSILETTVENSGTTTDSDDNPYSCDDTLDKVFLPSYKDYMNTDYGFAPTVHDSNSRCCKTTDWARARGAYAEENDNEFYNNNGYYWTRSPYSGESDVAWCVTHFGVIYSEDGSDVDSKENSVRPAITISF